VELQASQDPTCLVGWEGLINGRTIYGGTACSARKITILFLRSSASRDSLVSHRILGTAPPAVWPKFALIRLKWSMSRMANSVLPPSRAIRAMARTASASKARRLGRPVSESIGASCSSRAASVRFCASSARRHAQIDRLQRHGDHPVVAITQGHLAQPAQHRGTAGLLAIAQEVAIMLRGDRLGQQKIDRLAELIDDQHGVGRLCEQRRKIG
jgi:hypothetical protein